MFQEREKHMQRSCGKTDRGRYKAQKEGSTAGGERVRGKTGPGGTRLALDKGHSGFRVEKIVGGSEGMLGDELGERCCRPGI